MSNAKIMSTLAAVLPSVLASFTPTVDLSNADEEILPFVIAIDHGNFGEKPNCDVLELEMLDENGKSKKAKPSSAQRDAAWEYYQKAKKAPKDSDQPKVELKTNRNGTVAVEFLYSHNGYRKGEVVGLLPKEVSRLLETKNPPIQLVSE